MSKKLEGYKRQWDPEVFDGPHPDQEFKEIKRCIDCGGIVEEKKTFIPSIILALFQSIISVLQKWISENGKYICPNYGHRLQSIETSFQCSLCLEESETEECNCYES